MNKTAAKKSTSAAPAATKKLVPAKTKIAKPSPKMPPKPLPKTTSKASVKAPVKPAPPAQPPKVKPAATAATPPLPKSAPAPVKSPTPAAPSKSPATVAAASLAAVAATPAPPPPTRMTSSAKSKASAKAQAAYAAPAPMPIPTSRFADRFAPPRPPTRQMNHLEIDSPRQAQKSDPKLANAWKGKSGRDLTEPELLAMPEAEYMNDKQLEYFRATLQKLKDDLLSNAGETTEHLREDTSIVPDPADRATIEEEHALELRTRDRERKLLKKISQSLLRIESGEYGFCDETGEPIGLGRLLARPTATLSLEAQQRRELKQKMFGD